MGKSKLKTKQNKTKQNKKHKNNKTIQKNIWKLFSFLGSLEFYVFILIICTIFKSYTLFFNLSISLFLGYFITIVIRILYYKQRPNKKPFSNFLQKIDSSSFPSMHAIKITNIIFSLTIFFNNFIVSLFLLIIGIFVVLSRFFLKQHYISDLIAGIIIGILICTFVVLFFDKYILINYIL